MQKNPLWQDILKFSKNKNKLGVIFILLGLLGLLLPVIPGFALLGIGILFLKPEWYNILKKKFNKSEFQDNSSKAE